jgi:hypothetical protein
MTWLEAIRRFFTSRYVLHLEREVELWRGQNMSLLLQLQEALKPTVQPQVKREFPKVAPMRTSWESYLAEEIRKQEQEEVV